MNLGEPTWNLPGELLGNHRGNMRGNMGKQGGTEHGNCGNATNYIPGHNDLAVSVF